MHLPSSIAVLIYLGIVGYLFRRDFREKPNVTSALWLPWSWVVISGSRFISQWLGIFGLNIGGTSLEEGSPVDALYFFFAIIFGLRVLARRQVRLSEFMRHNQGVTFFILLCLLGCVWSDFPLVAFKRWTKLVGSPVMVLVVLTEPDPREAMIRLFKRVAYVIVPISVLFIKYFPDLGRTFDSWTGEATNTGITTDKNTMGFDCFILGFFFFWHMTNVWRAEKNKARRNELLFCAAFIGVIFWLMREAHSSTSLVCCLLAILIMWCLGLKFIRPRAITLYLVGIIATVAIAEFGFHASAMLIELLGKDSTLTGRTEIWGILMHWDVNPLLGAGYESFWLGERREKLWEMFPLLFLNSSHNGYLETYMNLGILGLLVTVVMLLAAYANCLREFKYDAYFARFRLGYLLAFLIYNCTEVAFRTHCVPFFVFFLVAIDYPWGGPLNSEWGPGKNVRPGLTDYEF